VHPGVARRATAGSGSDCEVFEVRTLVELAVENAVEGCVRETFGAAVAACQGEWACERFLARTQEPISPELSITLGLPGAAASARLITALAPLWS